MITQRYMFLNIRLFLNHGRRFYFGVPRHCKTHTLVRVKLMYQTPLGKSQLSRHPDVHESNFTFSWPKCNLGLIQQMWAPTPPLIFLLFIMGLVTWVESLLGCKGGWVDPCPPHIFNTLDTFSPHTMKLSELAKLISTESKRTRQYNWWCTR